MRLIIALLLAGCAWAQSPAEIEKTIKDELMLLVEQKLNKPALAKQVKIRYPITEPTMTEADIQAKIELAVQEEMAKHTMRSPEELEAAARERYPLYKIGDEVVIYTRRGQALRGTLREISSRFVKIDDRPYSKIDITKESLQMLDEEHNANMVKRYISNQTNIQADREKNTRAVLNDSLGRKLRLEAGYARFKGRWITGREYFDRALVWKRGQLAKQYRPEIEARVYGRFGYTREEGKWVPPAAGTEAIVATDDQGDFFSDDPVPVETAAVDSTPIAPPSVPGEQPKARDKVLNALKDQGAVENLPPSAAEYEPEPAPPPVDVASLVVEEQPEVTFEDKSEGAAPVPLEPIDANAQLAAFQARVDDLRPDGGGSGGLLLTLMAMLLVMATSYTPLKSADPA